MLRLQSLATRLMLSHLAVIALAVGLLGVAGLSLVQGYFEQAAQQSALLQARLIARACETDCQAALQLPSSALPAASNVSQQSALNLRQLIPPTTLPNQRNASDVDYSVLPRVQAEVPSRARVLAADGVVHLDSASIPETGANFSNDALVRAALQGRDGARSEAQRVLAAAPVLRNGRADGAVLVDQNLDDVALVLADIRLRLLLAAVPALLVSALMGWLLSRAITRPINTLRIAAEQLAQGNFAHQLQPRGGDELGALATSFVQMRADLQRMLQARTNFVSDVSHELRTPLTGLKGLLDTLDDGAIDDVQVRDRFLRAMRGETDRLIRLVSDLLTLTKADSGALALKREATELVSLMEQCALVLAPQAQTKRVGIRTQAGGPIHARVDGDRIRQVMLNVMDNAVRFAPTGSTVTVGVVRAADGIRIDIHDAGPGMTPEMQARAFDRFYRAEQSRARTGESGAGLGLAIAKALVDAHGGRISILSEPNAGTTVSVTLPQ